MDWKRLYVKGRSIMEPRVHAEVCAYYIYNYHMKNAQPRDDRLPYVNPDLSEDQIIENLAKVIDPTMRDDEAKDHLFPDGKVSIFFPIFSDISQLRDSVVEVQKNLEHYKNRYDMSDILRFRENWKHLA